LVGLVLWCACTQPIIAQPGFKQDLTAKQTEGQPKFAQQSEKILNQF
jgi:hypothetical protein